MDRTGYYLNSGLFVRRRWPVEDFVTVVLESSGTVKFPVLSAIQKDTWQDYDGYLTSHCLLRNFTVPFLRNPGTNTTSSKLKRRSATSDDLPLIYNDDPVELFDDAASSTTNLATTPTDDDPFALGTPLSSAPAFRSYQLSAPYEDVGVLNIGTFADWLDALMSGLNQMQTLGIKKLIIDVTGNPGGSVAAGQYLEQTLFPDKYPGFPTEARAPSIAVDCAAVYANLTAAPEFMYNYRAWCKVISFNCTDLTIS